LIILMLTAGLAGAQNDLIDAAVEKKKADLEELKAGGYFSGYFSPIISTLGTGLLTGLWKDADFKEMGLKLYLGLEAYNVWIPNNQLLFETPSKYSTGNVKTATIFGGKPAVVQDANGMVDVSFLPGLLPSEGSGLPLAMPKLTLGSFMGTGISARFLYLPDVFGLGEAFSLEGDKSLMIYSVGISHSISQYLSNLPLNAAAAFSYGSINLLDIIKVNAVGIDINISKKLAVLEALVGVGWEKSTGSIDFKITEEVLDDSSLGKDFEFALDEKNIKGLSQFHANLGLTLKLGLYSMHSIIHLGRQMSVSGGMGFDF
ncbi:MAG: DUF6588 family protein, partial [bacterium]